MSPEQFAHDVMAELRILLEACEKGDEHLRAGAREALSKYMEAMPEDLREAIVAAFEERLDKIKSQSFAE